jgi:signal transduction histidine kinase
MKVGRSLRFRMMFLFTAVVGGFLMASYLTIYLSIVHEIKIQYDKRLVAAAIPVAAELSGKPLGTETLGPETLGPDTLGLYSFEPETLALKYVEILDASGKVLQLSRTLGGHTLAVRSRDMPQSQANFATIGDEELGALRTVLVPFKQGGQSRVLLLSATIRCPSRVITRFRNLLLILLAPNLLLTYFVSAWYTRRSLAPVAELTRRAAKMSEQVSQSSARALWTPLPVAKSHDELVRLAESFNLLAESVQSALDQLRQFVSDASHELRTPLTVLHGEAELVLAEPRTPEQYKQALLVIKGELKKLNRMVEGLFTLSMADAGQLCLLREPLYLNEVLEESCALTSVLARAKGIRILRDLEKEVPYFGDEGFLRELFLIFLDNAIKYSPQYTIVRVDLQRIDGKVQVRFKDNGNGIPPEHLPHVFKRFYRAAPAASGEPQSGGLGLAIAQAIVQACSGKIECETIPHQGCTFTISLPIEGSDLNSFRPHVHGRTEVAEVEMAMEETAAMRT